MPKKIVKVCVLPNTLKSLSKYLSYTQWTYANHRSVRIEANCHTVTRLFFASWQISRFSVSNISRPVIFAHLRFLNFASFITYCYRYTLAGTKKAFLSLKKSAFAFDGYGQLDAVVRWLSKTKGSILEWASELKKWCVPNKCISP